MTRIENQNVVITGSSEGVGRTIAVEFAKEGGANRAGEPAHRFRN